MYTEIMRRRLAVVSLACVLASASASAQVSVEGSTVRDRRAQPGETYSGTFTVVNTSDESQQAKLYQTDYTTSADGTNAYGPAGTGARSNGAWVSVTPSTLVLPPRSSREVSFTVTVPADQSLSGSYWSMVMVEGVPRGSSESTLPAGKTSKVQTAVVAHVRYAVQIITQVGASVKPVATFEAPAVHAAPDGTKKLQVDLVNSGRRSFAPSFVLELYAQDGTHVRSVAATREILYPGTSLRQHFALGALPSGTYRALVTLDAGDDTVFGAQYTLKL
jgi:Fn3-like domain (DUF1034).